MEPAQVILNLWYVVDDRGMISSLRARAYAGTGREQEDQALLEEHRYADYVVAREFPVPERLFAEGGRAAPAGVLDEPDGAMELFREAIGELVKELPGEAGPATGPEPTVCVTALAADDQGDVAPADRPEDSPAQTSLRDAMRERLEWALEKMSFGYFSDVMDDIYIMKGMLWGEIPDESGRARKIDLSDDLRQELAQAMDAAWAAYADGSTQDQRLALGRLWRAFRQLSSGQDLGNIFKAVLAGDMEKAGRILAVYPAEASSEDEDSWTPLHWAVFEENVEMAELLILSGARVDAQAWEGLDELAAEAPLHIAARLGNIDVAETLLRHGASLELGDETGATPLNVAAAEGDAAMAEFLLELGADPETSDEKGRTPLDRARAAGADEVAQLLEARASTE